LIFTLRASFAEISRFAGALLASPKPCHPSGAIFVLVPIATGVVSPSWTPTRSLLRNGSTAGVAPWPIKILPWRIVKVLTPTGKTAANRLWFVKPVVVVIQAASRPAVGNASWGRFIFEVGRAPGLFGGDTPKSDAFISEEHGGTRQQELTELQDRIKTPTLKKENAAAEKADRCKENVVIPCQSRLERAHEVEQGPTHGKHNAHNAGPIQAGVNQNSASLSNAV
jgi:hypothetical protein